MVLLKRRWKNGEKHIYKWLCTSNIDLTDFKEFDSSKPGKYRIPFDEGQDADNMYVEFEIK